MLQSTCPSPPAAGASSGPALVQVEVRVLRREPVEFECSCHRTGLWFSVGEDRYRRTVGKPASKSVPSALTGAPRRAQPREWYSSTHADYHTGGTRNHTRWDRRGSIIAGSQLELQRNEVYQLQGARPYGSRSHCPRQDGGTPTSQE
jgi:hypothetical protein